MQGIGLDTMDATSAFQLVSAVALGVSLAAVAGLRAFLPLLVAGGLSRVGIVQLGESYNFIGSTPALVLFAVATVAEVVADKIPAVDHMLDAAGTFVRPVAGSLVAASAMWQVSDPLWAMVLGVMMGAPTALAPHAAKAVTRAASTSLTLGFANPVLSTMEDVGAAVLAVLAVVVPILVGLTLVVVLVVGLVLMNRWLQRRKPDVVTAPSGS